MQHIMEMEVSNDRILPTEHLWTNHTIEKILQEVEGNSELQGTIDTLSHFLKELTRMVKRIRSLVPRKILYTWLIQSQNKASLTVKKRTIWSILEYYPKTQVKWSLESLRPLWLS